MFISESQTEEVVILTETEVNVEGELECDEAMEVDDETKEESQEGHVMDDEGDPDWTSEEAESAYEQAGDDDCDQKPNPKYVYFVTLMIKS